MLTWGCRPIEATYIVHAKSIGSGKRFSAHFDAERAATCPTWYTKTKNLYKWPVWAETEWAVDALQALHDQNPTLKDTLGDPKEEFRKAL